MKILILANKPPYPPKDGGAIAIFNLAKGLAFNGHQVDILSMNTSKHKVNAINNNPFPNLFMHYVDTDTDISSLGLISNFLFSSIPYTASRFKNKGFESQLVQMLQSKNYDIVQFEGPYLGFYIPVVRKYSKARISIRAHNVEHEIWKRVALNEKNIFKKFYYNNLSKRIVRFERKIIMHSDALLPITERDKETFIKDGYNKPMQVTPVGIDILKDNITITRQRAIMFLGALDWAPNQEGLLWFTANVWPLIIAQNPYIIFHIAGRNAPVWLAKKLSMIRNVLFHGEVEKSSDFMEVSDIMVVPILSGSGMRVKIIEAMSYGKVVVTTTIGAEGINATSGEHLFIVDEPEKYAEIIINLISNNNLIEQIARNAHAFIGKFYNNTRIAQTVSDFYLQLTDKNK
jgi:glycosyltransferase involved in cell wall biosynthesis